MKMEQSNKSKLSMGRRFITAFVLSFLLLSPVLSNAQDKIKNVVLVHGAFADGSGWKGVFEILTKKGYHVTAVQIPLTSLKDDVDATIRILDKQDGPVILVGHSWGGVVITEAGMHPKVASLVYVAAYQPDKGENTLQWAATAPTLPEYGILPPDEKGFVYYDKAKFHGGFAGDLSQAETDFMFASQEPIFGGSFETAVADAAWKTKPTYGIVATEDKSINPEIERKMYKRSNTRVTEIKGSHVIFMSHPDAVGKVIIAASEKK
ncbi:pimeloyl-ACP methyl ester carboxylesterase [Mucilaginibacter sp. SG538B]|uniref:alpha/beta fold hydrolase n=1 Tax=Mucilaginibacter sp. SG538B TaxID=2587021 RepID=UPI00159D4AA8|nr:alpha/beta hydrolase [Mucilaginibacter sp. SG538B]NVM67669.1 pimeloyl-ACP methyl ester carboxylesterase [Mucilaginibacter sp. SG538B]